MNLFSDSINKNFFLFLWSCDSSLLGNGGSGYSWRRCAEEGQDITRMEALVMHGRSVSLEHSFAGESVDILANLKAAGFNSSTAGSIVDVSGEGIKSSVTVLTSAGLNVSAAYAYLEIKRTDVSDESFALTISASKIIRAAGANVTQATQVISAAGPNVASAAAVIAVSGSMKEFFAGSPCAACVLSQLFDMAKEPLPERWVAQNNESCDSLPHLLNRSLVNRTDLLVEGFNVSNANVFYNLQRELRVRTFLQPGPKYAFLMSYEMLNARNKSCALMTVTHDWKGGLSVEIVRRTAGGKQETMQMKAEHITLMKIRNMSVYKLVKKTWQ